MFLSDVVDSIGVISLHRLFGQARFPERGLYPIDYKLVIGAVLRRMGVFIVFSKFRAVISVEELAVQMVTID